MFRCKYAHPSDVASEGAAKLQDKMEFCHDFQNGRCHRTNCKFIHCNGEVEQEFKSSGLSVCVCHIKSIFKVPKFVGYLPPSVRDQVINKGVAVDFPAVNGGIPICKDFLKVHICFIWCQIG